MRSKRRLSAIIIAVMAVGAVLGPITDADAKPKRFASEVNITGASGGTVTGLVSAIKEPRCTQNRKVFVERNGQLVGQTRSDGNGNWSFDATTNDGDGFIAEVRRIDTSKKGKEKRTCLGDRSAEFVVGSPPPPPPPGAENLSVAVAGDGIVRSDPEGIACRKDSNDTDCNAQYASGTPVTLTATPDAGESHTGWGGACNGVAAGQPCTLTLSDDRAVTAVFSGPATSNLAVAVSGLGKVDSDPAGINNCRREQDPANPCSAEFPAGGSVTLTATPDAGEVFIGWGGACLGASTNSCTLSMTQDRAVTAAFSEPAPPVETKRLTVGVGGNGQVQSSPTGIDGCRASSGVCAHDFPEGSTVTLTATPDSDHEVSGWGAACASSGTASQCTVLMDDDKSATVTFEPTCGISTSITEPVRTVLCAVESAAETIL